MCSLLNHIWYLNYNNQSRLDLQTIICGIIILYKVTNIYLTYNKRLLIILTKKHLKSCCDVYCYYCSWICLCLWNESWESLYVCLRYEICKCVQSWWNFLWYGRALQKGSLYFCYILIWLILLYLGQKVVSWFDNME